MAAGPVYIAERTTGHGVEIHRGWLRIEISLTSETSFEDAIEQGIKSGGEECRNLVASAWVKDHRDNVDVGVIVRYQVGSWWVMIREGKPRHLVAPVAPHAPPVDTPRTGCEVRARLGHGGGLLMRRVRRNWTWALILGLGTLPLLGAPPAGAATSAQLIAANLNYPSMFTVAPDGRLFYAERTTGRVGVFNPGTGVDSTYFQVPELCSTLDQGLYGLALHPDFPADPSLYAYATR